MERHLFIRIMQEQRLQRYYRAVFEIYLVLVEVQHGVRGVGFAAEAIVSQHPIGTVGHVFDT